MYGDGPAWHPKLAGLDRHRAIINIVTRLRYCSPRGRISYEEEGSPGTQPAGFYPWYEVPGRAERDLRIVCGHWSTLGLFIGHGVHAIDTGAVWGGKLTALQLDTDELRVVQVPGRAVPATASPQRARTGERIGRPRPPRYPRAPATSAQPAAGKAHRPRRPRSRTVRRRRPRMPIAARRPPTALPACPRTAPDPCGSARGCDAPAARARAPARSCGPSATACPGSAP